MENFFLMRTLETESYADIRCVELYTGERKS